MTLSDRLRKISFNFCLPLSHFAELLQLGQNVLLTQLVEEWFIALKQSPKSTVINGLEFIVGIALVCPDGNCIEKASTVFDVFDFDDSGALSMDELLILMKSSLRALSKFTNGLGPRLEYLCPMSQIEELAKQCFDFAEIAECDELEKLDFLQWVQRTKKVTNLVNCFVPHKGEMTEAKSAVLIQRCARGKMGRKEALKIREEKSAMLNAEKEEAALRIQNAMMNKQQQKMTSEKLRMERHAYNGAAITFGSNAKNTLGHPNISEEQCILEPRVLHCFKTTATRIESGCLSANRASALTTEGELYVWGANTAFLLGIPENDHDSTIVAKPTKVPKTDKFTSASTGNRHSLASADDGSVLSWGSASFGQLGLGDFDAEDNNIFQLQIDSHTGIEYSYVDRPTMIPRSFFKEEQVIQVACGYYFSVAVTKTGAVFTWGEGSDGQLGLEDSEEFIVGLLDDYIPRSSFSYVHSPVHVSSLEVPIKSVSVGGNHVFAISQDRRMIFEWGAWGRRCGEDRECSFSPEECPELAQLHIDEIACGTDHAIALGGRVFVSTAATKDILAVPAKYGIGVADLLDGFNATLINIDLPGYEESLEKIPADCEDKGKAYEQILANSFKNIEFRAVLIQRGPTPGIWLAINADDGYEFLCNAAKFGPEITRQGITLKAFYSAEKIPSLKYYIRPEEIPGKIVVMEFNHLDLRLDEQDEEPDQLIQHLMTALVARVQDAQRAKAAALVIILDFHNADPFPLECHEPGFQCPMPVVMMGKEDGDLLQAYLKENKGAELKVFQRYDTMTQQIIAAQQAEALAVIVAQNEMLRKPTQLQDRELQNVEAIASTAMNSVQTIVDIPVVMVSFEDGCKLREIIPTAAEEGLEIKLRIGDFGSLYAWGCGEEGRLGLGDVDNDSIFEAGYDGISDMNYQFVRSPELLQTLVGRQVIQMDCGEDHSGAVTADKGVWTWGNGEGGRLGHKSEEDEYYPRRIRSLKDVKVKQIVCADASTMLITELGNLRKVQIDDIAEAS